MTIALHERFTGFPALFDSHIVNHVTGVKSKWGPSKMMIMPSGSVDVQAIAQVFGEHGADMTSGDLAAILGFCPAMSGYLLSGAGAVLQFQQRALGGTFQGASSHVTLTSPAGFLHIDSIDATQDSKEGAKVKLSFYPLPTTGVPVPVTMQTGQSLTGSVAVNGLYKLSTVTFEGTAVLGVQSVGFKTGIKVSAVRSSGLIYADTLSIGERKPTLTIRGTNLSLLDAITPDMSVISAGISVFFQQVGVSGTHGVTITFAGGVYSADGPGASGTGDAESNVMVDLSGGTSNITVAIS